MEYSRSRVRPKRPAPITSRTEIATCAAISPLPQRQPAPKRASASAGWIPWRVAWIAGARLNNRHAAAEMDAAKARMRRSGRRFRAILSPPLDIITTSALADHQASNTPSTPAAIASSMPSASIWRRTRPRPAPRASRMAISRRRVVARPSSRLARLAQAISRINATMPIRSRSGSAKRKRRKSNPFPEASSGIRCARILCL